MNRSPRRVRTGQSPPPRSLHGRGYATAAPSNIRLRGGAPLSPSLASSQAQTGPRNVCEERQTNLSSVSWPGSDWNPPHLGLGSSLSYSHVRDSGTPTYGPPFPPVLDRPQPATPNARVLVSSSRSGGKFVQETVYLVNNNLSNAYRLLKVQAEIKRAGVLWGGIAICLVLEKDPRGVVAASFREPDPGSELLVAVKELNMQEVDTFKLQGGMEDPDVELAASEFVGDGVHVLRHEKVFTDGTRRYIVMPFCSGGDVWEAIPWKSNMGHMGPGGSRMGMGEEVVRKHFREMLKCSAHMQGKGASHGDLSPENIMIHNGDCIFIDLGMSLLVAPSPDGQQGGRVLQPWQGRRGKCPYMAPELFSAREEAFDGFFVDIYSLGAILYAMLTGLMLQDFPTAVDQKYRLFVLGDGLCDEDPVLDYICSRVQTDRFGEENTAEILNRLNAHRDLSDEAKDLIWFMTRPNPEERMTLEQVVRHEWVVGPRPARVTRGWATAGHPSVPVGEVGLPSGTGVSERINDIKNDAPPMRAVSYFPHEARVLKAALPLNADQRLHSPTKPTPKTGTCKDITGRDAYFARPNHAGVVSGDEKAVIPPTQRKRWAPVLRPLPPYYSTSSLFNVSAEIVAVRLSECARLLGMRATFDDDEATAILETSDNVKLRLALFQGPVESASECVAVDLQRLSGCSLRFLTHRSHILSTIFGNPLIEDNFGALFDEARNRVDCFDPIDVRDEAESSYLALLQAAKLIGRENVDDILLGLEFLCLLTDPRKTQVETATAASRAVLVGELEHPDAPIKNMILSLLLSEHRPENQAMAEKSLTARTRRLALEVFANALDVNVKYDSDTSVPAFLASSSPTRVESALVDALRTAETNPHEAFLAARSLRCLCRSSGVRDTLRGLAVIDAIEGCLAVGKEMNRPLEQEVISIALYNYEATHALPHGSVDVDALAGTSAGVAGWAACAWECADPSD